MGSMTQGMASASKSIMEGIAARREKEQEKAEISTRIENAVKLATEFGGEELGERIASFAQDTKTSEGATNLEAIIKQQIGNKLDIESTGAKEREKLASDIMAGKAEQAGMITLKQEMSKVDPKVTQGKITQKTELEKNKFQNVEAVTERAFKLRNEFQALPLVKEYQVVRSKVTSMDALMEGVKKGDEQSKLALDQGLITLFNKITDPESVVRESEYERTGKNLSLINRFKGAFQKLKIGGAGLTDEDRDALVFGAKLMANARTKQYNKLKSNYDSLSNSFGAEADLVTGGYGAGEEFDLKTSSSKKEQKTISGISYEKREDGKWYKQK